MKREGFIAKFRAINCRSEVTVACCSRNNLIIFSIIWGPLVDLILREFV